MNPLDAMATLLAAEKDPSVRELPEFAEAQAMVSADSELNELFDAEKAFYESYDDLLGAVRLPAEARSRIQATLEDAETSVIAPQDSSEPSSPESPEDNQAADVVKMPRRNILFLAAAAVLGLVAISAVANMLLKQDIQADTFREFASLTVENGFGLDSFTPTVTESVNWLTDEGGPAPHPDNAGTYPSKGCTIVDWNGTKVSIICMKKGKDPLVHLFVIDRSTLSDAALASLTGRTTKQNRETYAWSCPKNAYVLVADKPNRPLKIPQGLVASAS